MIGVGDLVVCVDASPCRCGCGQSALTDGRIYRVLGIPVTKSGSCRIDVGANTPHHIRSGSSLGWLPDRFRKVEQDKREACEEEFRILLKLSKQRVSA